MAQFDKMFEKFAESEIQKPFLHVSAEAADCIRTVEGLNRELGAIHEKAADAYADKEVIEDFYLRRLPEEYPAYPFEMFAIHEVLLDLYQFLFKEKYIKLNVYYEMLAFFQERKDVFFDRMMSEEYWSENKVNIMEELIDQDYKDIFADDEDMLELKKVFDELKKILPNPIAGGGNAKGKSNVLPFPGGSKKKAPKGLVYQFRIDIKGFKPPVWRRVLVPASDTLEDLHDVIQRIFEWDDYHLHSFETPYEIFEPSAQSDGSFDTTFGPVPEESADVLLSEVFSRYDSINYTYDFGDDWEHKIKLEKEFTPKELADSMNFSAKDLPICIKGKGDAPAEDSRFEEIYEAFDMEAVNTRLNLLKGKKRRK